MFLILFHLTRLFIEPAFFFTSDPNQSHIGSYQRIGSIAEGSVSFWDDVMSTLRAASKHSGNDLDAAAHLLRDVTGGLLSAFSATQCNNIITFQAIHENPCPNELQALNAMIFYLLSIGEITREALSSLKKETVFEKMKNLSQDKRDTFNQLLQAHCTECTAMGWGNNEGNNTLKGGLRLFNGALFRDQSRKVLSVEAVHQCQQAAASLSKSLSVSDKLMLMGIHWYGSCVFGRPATFTFLSEVGGLNARQITALYNYSVYGCTTLQINHRQVQRPRQPRNSSQPPRTVPVAGGDSLKVCEQVYFAMGSMFSIDERSTLVDTLKTMRSIRSETRRNEQERVWDGTGVYGDDEQQVKNSLAFLFRGHGGQYFLDYQEKLQDLLERGVSLPVAKEQLKNHHFMSITTKGKEEGGKGGEHREDYEKQKKALTEDGASPSDAEKQLKEHHYMAITMNGKKNLSKRGPDQMGGAPKGRRKKKTRKHISLEQKIRAFQSHSEGQQNYDDRVIFNRAYARVVKRTNNETNVRHLSAKEKGIKEALAWEMYKLLQGST